MHLWKDVFPAVTTQFYKDQTLDLEGTAKHLEVMIDSGIAGLIMCGSLGENQQLTPEEKRKVISLTLQVAKKRLPVLSGVAEMSTAAACQYVADCEQLGADGFMVMPAMVYKADGAEAMNHFRRVAAATSKPWMLYNNPVGYTVDISASQFAELSNIKNLIAIKESSANTRRITELRIEVGDRYALFTGVDDLILQSSALGIDGWVAGSGVAFPYENQYFWNMIQAGKWEEAREFYKWFYPLLKLDTYLKFVQYIKLAVQEVGLGAEWVREPRLALTGEERTRILKVIHHGIATRPKLTTK
jgi:1-pyrroline-4-hydroxy-2-carboxylate deaminase